MRVSDEQRAEWQAEQGQYERAEAFKAEAIEKLHDIIDQYIELKVFIRTFGVEGGLFDKAHNSLTFAWVRDVVQNLGEAAIHVQSAAHMLSGYVDGRDYERYHDVLILGRWEEDKGRPKC